MKNFTEYEERIYNFAEKLSEICGEHVYWENIIMSTNTGIYFYIQPPMQGAPMLLRHYSGHLFVKLNREDFRNIEYGYVSADDFINSANWLVGYYWAGGSMLKGGYYQPIDIVNRKDELQRYLRILACRTHADAWGYKPKFEKCTECEIQNCPYSPYDCKSGKLEDEAIQEVDPRIPVFNAIKKRFESLYPGYTLAGWHSTYEDQQMNKNEVRVNPLERLYEDSPYYGSVWLPSEFVRGLLDKTIDANNPDELVKDFQFFLCSKEHPELTLDMLHEIYAKDGMDRPRDQAKKEAAEKVRLEEERKASERAKWGIFGFVYDMIHK